MKINDVINISDLRHMAKKRLPRMVFDYIDGGADDEITLAKNTNRLREIEILWRTLIDVDKLDTKTKIMGRDCDLPFFISPTATSRLFHPKGGELAVAKAAQNFGTAYSISTLGSHSIEEVAAVNNGPKYFQIYVWKDKEIVKDIIQRVKAAGFDGIILTVDLPVPGNRERDPRNHFTVPPKPNLSLAIQALMGPQYVMDMLTSPKIDTANFRHLDFGGQSITEFLAGQFLKNVTWKDVEWMRSLWDKNFAIKGISMADDADIAIKNGIDTVWVSNHGGRQLDTAPATIDTLPLIIDKVAGRAEVILDGGIRRGSDIFKALAMGANSVAIGRAYLYGLGAAGQIGVEKALKILKSELERTMALCGTKNISEITKDYIFKP